MVVIVVVTGGTVGVFAVIGFDNLVFVNPEVLGYLQGCIFLFVEIAIVIEAELGAEHLEVVFGNEQRADAFEHCGHVLVAVKLLCVCVDFVVAEESTHDKHADTAHVADFEVEVADKKSGEVIACNLEQELVFVEGILRIGQDECKLADTCIPELCHLGAVGTCHICTQAPYSACIPFTIL